MSKETFDPTKYNQSGNETFDSILEKRMSRRDAIKGGAAMAALTMFSGFGLTGCDDDNNTAPAASSTASVADTTLKLGFDSIPGSLTDSIAVAAGYTAQVLAPWGTPLNNNAAAWKNDGTNTSADQANAVGMHHDGMHYFPLNGSSEDGLLCINHEYIDRNALHADSETRNAEYVRKQINAHGVSVVRVQLKDGEWKVVDNDYYNRRFTAASPMKLSGPVAQTSHTVTPYSNDGDMTRGTINNCGNGYTPWGTYLTCEENWPGYFVAEEATQTADQKRIGMTTPTSGWYKWHDQAGDSTEQRGEFARFNVTPDSTKTAKDDWRNEANGYGYIVEIDPYDPTTLPTKRTAMGRFRHEGVVFGKLEAGKPMVFYSGHDARFEYLYKFVSSANWDPADANPVDRLATGAKYMDKGTLYVARFDEKGNGAWLPLTLSSATTTGGTLADTFASEAEIIINTAGAADLVGATPMDRPEWTAVDPVTGSVYLTLTNNTKRTTTVNAANPRLNNKFGHIVRWDDDATDPTKFTWDIFVFGSPENGDAETNLSGLGELNQFASPDGLVFDSRGIMWIQTDNGASEVTSYTNDQMLAVIPSNLKTEGGDYQTINKDNQSELRRFFVGPNGCEVTGLAITPDQTTFFINIQHPGNWPAYNTTDATKATGSTVRPRAATVVVRKTDGGKIGV